MLQPGLWRAQTDQNHPFLLQIRALGCKQLTENATGGICSHICSQVVGQHFPSWKELESTRREKLCCWSGLTFPANRAGFDQVTDPKQQIQSRGSQTPADPRVHPQLENAVRTEKIRAGDSSGLTLSHGISLGPSLGSSTKALFFLHHPFCTSQPLITIQTFGTATKTKLSFQRKHFPFVPFPWTRCHSPFLYFCTQLSHLLRGHPTFPHPQSGLESFNKGQASALTAFTTIVESEKPHSHLH